MDQLDIDNRMKELLSDQAVNIDTDKLWNEVNPHIVNRKRPKRRGVIFILSLLGSVLISVFSLMHFDNKNQAKDNNLSNEKEMEAFVEKKAPIIQPIVEDISITAEVKENVIPSKYFSSVDQKTNDEIEMDVLMIATDSSPFFEDFAAITSSYLIEDMSTSINNSASINTIFNSSMKEAGRSSGFKTNDRKSINPSKTIKYPLPEVPKIELRELHSQRVIQELKSKFLTVQESKKTKQSMLALQIYSGLGKTDRKIVNESGMYVDLISDWNQYEFQRYSLNLGGALRIHLHAKFDISIGLELDVIQENAKYEQFLMDTIYLSNERIIENLELQNGEVVNLYGIDNKTVHRTWDIYNEFFFVNMPIEIRFKHELKKMTFSVSKIITTNVATWENGKRLTLENRVVQNPFEYKSTLQPRLGIAVGLDYNLSERLKLNYSVVKMFKNDLISTADDEIIHRYSSLKMRLGLEYRL